MGAWSFSLLAAALIGAAASVVGAALDIHPSLAEGILVGGAVGLSCFVMNIILAEPR